MPSKPAQQCAVYCSGLAEAHLQGELQRHWKWCGYVVWVLPLLYIQGMISETDRRSARVLSL